MRYLLKICSLQALVPRPLAIPLCYDPTETPLCHGGFADMWKGQHCDKEVAAKVLRIYPKGDFEGVKNVGFP